MLKTLFSRFCIVLALVLLSVVATAQEGVAIALSIPAADEDLYSDLAAQFEAANPSIQVRLVTNPFDVGNDEPADINAALDEILGEVQTADVLLIDQQTVTAESVIAGYFLDLTPLIQIDPEIDSLDFYDAFWQSYQWDGGMWALPVSGDVTMLLYDPVKFDNAGVFYPNASWNLRDLDEAIRALTEYDENDNVTRSAVLDFTENQGIYAIFVNLLGEGVYDFFAAQSTPYFENPLLEDLLTIWAEVTRDGLLGTNPGDFEEPMILGPSFLANVPQVSEGLEVISVPGGRPNVTANGFAVSAGSRNPEAAYELAKFLTLNRDLAESLGDIPARRSLAAEVGFDQFEPDVAAAVETSLENALPIAEMRFTAALEETVQLMVLQDLDARTALEQIEAEVIADLQVAADRALTDDVTVQLPQEIVLAPGEIALNFGYSSIVSPLPSQQQWEDFIEEFVAFDPEVGAVSFDVRQEFVELDLASITEVYDCFYLPDNQVPGADLTLLLNYDPLLANDFSFDQTDYVGNVFTQVQREDQTWALPLVLQPEVMFYNADLFALSGLPLPSGTWTVTEFEDAMRNLKVRESDPAPFVPQNIFGTYIQVLLASYGGLPIDYRTTPPTIQFNDPNVVQAAEEVLNLAKDGFIKYDGLTNFFPAFFAQSNNEVAILNRLLNPIGDFLPGNASESEANRLITFPQGAQLNAVSYDLGTVYISASTQYAEACYRFISEVARNVPTLFNEMPARRSQINDPVLADEQGFDAVAFYTALDQLMQQPTTVLIPTPLNAILESATTFLTTLWLNRAFDNYVFDDADLELELQQAQTFAQEFLACADELPEIDPSADNFDEVAEQILDCATGVDPTFEELLGL